MRGWLLAGSVAVVAVLIALASPSAGSTSQKYVTVALTATGPSPSPVTLSAGFTERLDFVNKDSVDHAVVFPDRQANGHCSIDVAPGTDSGVYSCLPQWVGKHSYIVDGCVRLTSSLAAKFSCRGISTSTTPEAAPTVSPARVASSRASR